MTIERRTHAPANAGDVKTEVDRIVKMINSPGVREMRDRVREEMGYVRPRNAATMVLVDGSAGNPRVLMGRRNRNLKFMPGALVFPGGSVDRGDGHAPSHDELLPATESKILEFMRGKPSRHKARALGLAAIRETAEETGLLLGNSGTFNSSNTDWKPFRDNGVVPSLSAMRLLSRAITPPGLARRFDTWFFAARADAVCHVPQGGFEPCGELEELGWFTFEQAIASNTREITRVMMVELMNRLKRDPGLDPSFPAPYYYSRQNRFFKKIM